MVITIIAVKKIANAPTILSKHQQHIVKRK